jgi:hypothetical protein
MAHHNNSICKGGVYKKEYLVCGQKGLMLKEGAMEN